MKSTQLTGMVLAATLAFSSVAFARGPSGAMAQGAGSSAAAGSGQGAGTRSGGVNAQSGGAPSTATRAQVHTPGTGLTDPDLRTGQPRGIHTPGTGLVTTTAQ